MHKKIFVSSAVSVLAITTLLLTGCTSEKTDTAPSSDPSSPSSSSSEGGGTTSPDQPTAVETSVAEDGTTTEVPKGVDATTDDGQESIAEYNETYTKYVSCLDSNNCTAKEGSLTKDCTTELPLYEGASLFGYTVEYQDTEQKQPVEITCSWGSVGEPNFGE